LDRAWSFLQKKKRRGKDENNGSTGGNPHSNIQVRLEEDEQRMDTVIRFKKKYRFRFQNGSKTTIEKLKNRRKK